MDRPEALVPIPDAPTLGLESTKAKCWITVLELGSPTPSLESTKAMPESLTLEPGSRKVVLGFSVLELESLMPKPRSIEAEVQDLDVYAQDPTPHAQVHRDRA